jgi:hypothetical protein
MGDGTDMNDDEYCFGKKKRIVTDKPSRMDPNILIEHAKNKDEGYVPLSRGLAYEDKKEQILLVSDIMVDFVIGEEDESV